MGADARRSCRGGDAAPARPSATLPVPELAMVTGRLLHCVDIPALDLPGYRLLRG
ncbi:hypothetical protein ACFFMP_14925 [Pseudoroseomonas cervicalis]|uniref:hypothetical protein n=1 Tax=Teichococcus cervicalis TaxID=204525 RepID=UPI0035E645D3